MVDTKKQDGETHVIVDNFERSVAEVLNSHSEEGGELDVISAYFSINGYTTLRSLLDSCSNVRFLYGAPSHLWVRGIEGRIPLSYENSGDALQPKNELTQSYDAKSCHDWVSKKSVQIHELKSTEFLHGKFYQLRDANQSSSSTTLVGSSNLTARGLNHVSEGGNRETNHIVTDQLEQAEWQAWFEKWWREESVSVKEEVLKLLERVYRPYSAKLIYYKTLFEIFKDRVTTSLDEEAAKQVGIRLGETNLWKKLFQFQRDAAINIIQRLQYENGLILADSTGLGKTLTALAVMYWFSEHEGEVLLLCPKRLEHNWMPYTRDAAAGNPLRDRGVRFTVAAHTDLIREQGSTTSGIPLTDWSPERFKLVVIDESHAFRNSDTKSYEYLSKIVATGVQTKVLLLTATPVNNRLNDLQSQLLLMNSGDDSAYSELLGINSVTDVLGRADKEFDHFVKTGSALNTDLTSVIGQSAINLITHTTIARSREHIQNYYDQDLQAMGGKFPKRTPPESLSPKIDTKNRVNFGEISDKLLRDWSVYQPEKFLRDKEALDTSSSSKLSSYAHLMRSNLVKRLESSVHALDGTLGRMRGKAENRIKWCDGELDVVEDDVDVTEEELSEQIDSDQDEQQEESPTAERVLLRGILSREDIDVETYKDCLQSDIDVIDEVRKELDHILTGDRDGKFKKLLEELLARHQPQSDNKKTIIFTAFADTAHYLFDSLKKHVVTGELPPLGLATGNFDGDTFENSTSRQSLLRRFAPAGQSTLGEFEPAPRSEQIDIMISTDCLSEGQNLQDADVVIHYDVHWNPVRLIQRFGRIDRLTTKHDRVHQTIFWPTEDIEEYLELKKKVESKGSLVTLPTAETSNHQRELDRLRSEDLKKLRDQALSIEDLSETKSLSNLSLHDFIEDLIAFLKQHRKELEEIPLGTVSTVSGGGSSGEPEVVFCLRCYPTNDYGAVDKAMKPEYQVIALQVNGDGRPIRHGKCDSMKTALELMRDIQSESDGVDAEAHDLLVSQLGDSQQIKVYDDMLNIALEWAKKDLRADEKDAKASNSKFFSWEIVSWLVRGPRVVKRKQCAEEKARPEDAWLV